MARFEPFSTAPIPERTLLVGVDLDARDGWTLEDSMDELARLAETDGAVVVGRLTQRLDSPIPRTFIGKGKTEELVGIVHAEGIDVVIFDDELTPSQQSNLEKIVGEPVKIIDRTALILDIFGSHATTKEGRLQVQLAQLQYVLPRLRGMWSHLVGEQTRGGIGSRFGQGESQLEVDRRLIRDRISTLKVELARLETQRSTQSKARWDSGVFRISLAGYTNAGKSTLLNLLTGSDVYAKDELFATLDPTTRSLSLPEGRKVTITDTVGFIQKLPTTLVAAFRSTLSEVASADLILEVVDARDTNRDLEVQAVEDVLGQIGAERVPRIVVYNKSDLLTADEITLLRTQHPSAVVISATEERGIGELLYALAQAASSNDTVVSACIPYEKGLLTKLVHEQCQIVRETFGTDGTHVTARVPQRVARLLAPYRTDGDE